MASLADRLDTFVTSVLSDWSFLTTILALILVSAVLYPIVTSSDPDTHPLLLERQASVNHIRNRGESALYRSPEVPHGYPLKTGLNVKDAGAPRWASGKDGDLRDIWREVQRGGTTGQDGKEVPKGLIMSVFGKEELVEHKIEDLSREIQVIGKHLKDCGIGKVAIYLPNNVEYLLAVFACSFYGLTPVLLPYNLPHPKVYELIAATEAIGLICAAGSLPLDNVATECKNLRLLTWVVEPTSRHMDWNGTPEAAQGRLVVSVWHDVVEENKSRATSDLPTNEDGDPPAGIVTIWQPIDMSQRPEIVSFTHGNMVAGTSALISTLPTRQRLSSADLVLPASGFHIPYVLCQTFAAIFQHASLAITSVAAPGVELALATRGTSPTVIIASVETLVALHQRESAGMTYMAQKVGKFTQDQTMSAGRMPTDSLLFRLLAPNNSSSGNAPGNLRLIFTSERLGAGTPALTSTMLSDLRVYTRARICYALTTAKVAGAVAQTNVFDYRRQDGRKHSHFGAPLSCVEVKVVNRDDGMLERTQPEGEIVISGPAVSGSGEVNLGVRGRFGSDGTLALI